MGGKNAACHCVVSLKLKGGNDMKRRKGIQLGILLTTMLMVSITVVLAVDGEGNILTSVFALPAQPKIGEIIPGPEIPTLTENEKIRAKEIVLDDSKVREILNGKDYKFGDVGVSHTEKLEKIGAAVELQLDKNYWMEINWTKPTGENILSKSWVQNIIVSVSLENSSVTGIMPGAGRGQKVPDPDSVFAPELEKAKEIAFNETIVKENLKGKNYKLEPVGIWYPENITAFRIHFDKSYKDDYTWMSKGKNQQAIIETTGMGIMVDIATGKVVDISPVIG